MHTGEKIRTFRLLKGLSQENMADSLRLSRQAYGDIERGQTDVTESRLQEIAEVLQVSPSSILELPDKIASFFDKCSGIVGINTHITQNNSYDQRELEHRLEISQLEIQRLQLECDKHRLERDKAILETQLLRRD